MFMFIPYVSEMVDGRERISDVYSRLLRDRIIFLNGPITSELSNGIIAQMLFLSGQDPEADIKLYISSGGGQITSGVSIIDTMNFIPNDVEVLAIGQVASMASIILACGTPGKRKILPHSTVMIHQPLIQGGLGGSATDIAIQVEELMRWKKITTQMLADKTGQNVDKVKADVERDHFMNAEQALTYGIVDTIIGQSKEAKKEMEAGKLDQL